MKRTLLLCTVAITVMSLSGCGRCCLWNWRGSQCCDPYGASAPFGSSSCSSCGQGQYYQEIQPAPALPGPAVNATP